MKIPLALSLLCFALIGNAQSLTYIGSSAAYRGDYVAVLMPSPRCSNERLKMSMTVDSDGFVECYVERYSTNPKLMASQFWPYFDRGRFNTDITSTTDRVQGRFSAKTGTCKGIVVLEGCRYTYTAYRQYKVPQ